MEDRHPALHVIQLSDCHLLADSASRIKGWDTHELFKQTLQCVAENHADTDLILLTGDLSQDGSLISYNSLKMLLAPLGIPAYALPGNHDHFTNMQAVFSKPEISCNKIIKRNNWLTLLLNSSVENETRGTLSATELEWLEAQLSQHRQTPTLLAVHHPVFPTGSQWMDELGMTNPQQLLDIIDKHPQVKLVLCGHIHQAYQHTRNGVQFLGTPSTCFQFKPKADTFELDTLTQGYRWLELLPNGEIKTGIERVSQ